MEWNLDLIWLAAFVVVVFLAWLQRCSFDRIGKSGSGQVFFRTAISLIFIIVGGISLWDVGRGSGFFQIFFCFALGYIFFLGLWYIEDRPALQNRIWVRMWSIFEGRFLPFMRKD